jgi:signal transduction histidine kinase
VAHGRDRTNWKKMLYIIISLLSLLVVILAVRLHQYKRQIKIFAEKTGARVEFDMNAPVSVDYFSKEITDLANALNAYTDKAKKYNLDLVKEQQRLKNVMAGISHDFRTPLTAARGYLQLLDKKGAIGTDERKYYNIIIEKMDYLAMLSDAFFSVSKIEAGGEDIELHRVNITNLLTETLLGQYPWIEENGIRLTADIPEQDIYVMSNEDCLMRIFNNIFSNARKYAETSLSISLKQADPEDKNNTSDKNNKYNKNNYILTFENDMELRDEIYSGRVLEAFYRGSSRTSEGSGLGLYIVEQLAVRMNHRVEVEINKNIFKIILIFSL